VTDIEIREVMRKLHPDLRIGAFELLVCRTIAEACKEKHARIAEIPHMTPKDIARVIRSDYQFPDE
jgi:hypothetical protein